MTKENGAGPSKKQQKIDTTATATPLASCASVEDESADTRRVWADRALARRKVVAHIRELSPEDDEVQRASFLRSKEHDSQLSRPTCA